MPNKIKAFGWYGAGWAVFKSGTDDDDFYPPLDDLAAQQEWLDGFGAAWVEYPDEEAIASILFGDGLGGESQGEALARALAGRPELLRLLLAQAPGQGGQTRH